MSEDESRFREVLQQIGELARSAASGGDHGGHAHSHHADQNNMQSAKLTCTPRSLPERLLVEAARTATTVYPVNAPHAGGSFTMGAAASVLDPLQIAVLTTKYWGPAPRRLTVSFMESTQPNLRALILSHMNAWATTSGISFVETQGVGQVRISRAGSGYWSYLGTDILHIPSNRPTMNLQGFSMSTPMSEYKRVVRHETGHTLGFPHEHMRRALVARIDPQKAYDYFLRTQGWDRATVDAQVLTPLNEQSLMATPPDQTSIMCYQLPGSITRNGQPILGGTDINPTDYAFAGKIYPKAGHAPGVEAVSEGDYMSEQGGILDQADDWDPSEDVHYALQAAE